MFAENNGKFQIRPAIGSQVKIAIAGDVCPHRSAEEYLLAGNAGKLLAGIQGALDDADLRIVQWETVISDTPDPITKCGPNLLVKPGCEAFLTAGKFDIALMANNHTGDHAGAGVVSTMDMTGAEVAALKSGVAVKFGFGGNNCHVFNKETGINLEA